MEKIKKRLRYDNKHNNIIILLTNRFYDIGFYSDSEYDNNENIQTFQSKTISGTTISRLNELKLYTESLIVTEKYTISINGSNGIIINETDEDKITYTVNGVKYVDDLTDGSTTFIFNTPAIINDIDNNILIKEDKYLNFVGYKESSDLDIVRQSLNITESHIRLTDISNVEELTLYGGGYYNIYNNS
jgi:hypothetical protein